MFKRQKIAIAAAALVAALPLQAQETVPAIPPAPGFSQSSTLVPSSAVVSFYKTFRPGDIWVANQPATEQLLRVLKQSAIDGFGAGPAYANEIEAKLARVLSMTPEQRQELDELMSTAWVGYVQTIKAPVPGMIYGDDYATPKGTQPHEILLTAQAAQVLAVHVSEVASVNYFYNAIRTAALADMAANGQTTPDPRIMANLERARAMPMDGRYVVVDAATQTLYMMEDGKPVDQMKVIVGKKQYATPMIASTIYYATYNPYWNVPDHLVRQAVARRIKSQGAAYYKPRGYELMSGWTNDATVLPINSVNWDDVIAGRKLVRIRQQPGPGNSMGDIKFTFPNGEGIFLHDTPSKQLFAKSSRDLSNGCIRLEDAFRLGRWLLKGPAVAPSDEAEILVPLTEPVRVYVTYLTAHPDDTDTQLVYVKDIYAQDPA